MAGSLSDKAIFIYDTFFSASITQGQLDTQIKQSSLFRLAFEEVISYPNLLDQMKSHDRYNELIGLTTEAYSMITSNITREENAQLEANAFQFMSNESNNTDDFATFLTTVSGHVGFGNIINNPKTSSDLATNEHAVDLILSNDGAIKALLNSPNGLNAFGAENLSALKIFQNASVFSKLRASLRFEQNDVLPVPTNTTLWHGPRKIGTKYFYLIPNENHFYMSPDMYTWEKVNMPNGSSGAVWTMRADWYQGDMMAYDSLNEAYFFMSTVHYTKMKWTKDFVTFFDVNHSVGNTYLRTISSWKGKLWFFDYTAANQWKLSSIQMEAGQTNYIPVQNSSQPTMVKVYGTAPSDDFKYFYWTDTNYHFTFMNEAGNFDTANQAGYYLYQHDSTNNRTWRHVTFANGYYFVTYGVSAQMGVSKIDLLANNDSLFSRPYVNSADRLIDNNGNKVSYWISYDTNSYHQVSYANGVYIIPITGGYATSLNGVTWDEQLFDVTYAFNIKGADDRGFYGNIPGTTFMITSYDSSQAFSLNEVSATTTTTLAPVLNAPEGISELECLTDTTSASVVDYNGDKMVFNSKDYYENTNYVVTNGIYKILNVPEQYPIAVLNYGKADKITYTGNITKKHFIKTIGTDSDASYDFFYGDVTIKVTGNFERISLYYYKVPTKQGYLGMEKLLVHQDYLTAGGVVASDNVKKVSDTSINSASVRNFNCVGSEARENGEVATIVYTTTTTTAVPSYTSLGTTTTTTTATPFNYGNESYTTAIDVSTSVDHAIDINASNKITLDGVILEDAATAGNRYCLGAGTYVFNIAADKSIAIEGATMSPYFGSQESRVSYSGDFYKRKVKSINGIPHYFYHGKVILIVDDIFSTLSLHSFDHGYAGAQNSISFSRITTTTTTASPTTTTTTDSSLIYTRCLSSEEIVTGVAGKYLFSGNAYNASLKLGLNTGTTRFKNIPQTHPIAILNYGKWSSISYTGDAMKSVSHIGPDGHQYQYYYGDVTVSVNGDFGLVSYDCYYHGHMGGENKLIFSGDCGENVVLTTTAAPTTTTTTTAIPNSILVEITTTTTTAVPTTTTTSTAAPSSADFCLVSGSVGNISSYSGGNILFNGNSGLYGMTTGTYIFKNVSASHPMAFLNYGKTNNITYTGQYSQGNKLAADGYQYPYYYGDVTVTVTGDFNFLSYECYYHGYMGGENNIIFDNTNCT